MLKVKNTEGETEEIHGEKLELRYTNGTLIDDLINEQKAFTWIAHLQEEKNFTVNFNASYNDQELTREMLDQLAGEAAALQADQEKKSVASGQAVRLLEEKTKLFGENLEALRKKMERNLGEIPNDASQARIQELAGEWEMIREAIRLRE